MNNYNCYCKVTCTGLAVIASIIIGIIAGILRFTAVITLTPAFLWVILGVAVVYLAIILGISTAVGISGARNCICATLPILLTGILGTILTSIILLGITFAATSVLGAIISGAALGFFSLIITSSACYAKCLAGCYGSSIDC